MSWPMGRIMLLAFWLRPGLGVVGILLQKLPLEVVDDDLRGAKGCQSSN
jgi:hypothetical protein